MSTHPREHWHRFAATILIALAAIHAPQATIADDTPTARAGKAIDLRKATLPPSEPQQFQLEIKERRETTLSDGTATTQEMVVGLAGKLRRDRERADGTVEATLMLKRITVSLASVQPAGGKLVYDSEADAKSQASPLADLMSAIRDAELPLVIGPDGSLRSLHGLDARWRQAKVLAAPPALMGVQLQFRDIGMKELIAEALFPPMPGKPLKAGETWDAELPVSLPAAARLVSKLRHRLGGTIGDGPEEYVGSVSVEAQGVIEEPPPILPGIEPSLRSRVRSSKHHVESSVHPERQELSLVSDRELDLELQQMPPGGGDSPTLRIHQSRRLWAARGKMARRKAAP